MNYILRNICKKLKITEPGDTLDFLYNKVEPTKDKPLIVLFDEIDVTIDKIHNNKITLHKHIPIEVYDTNSYNTFFDDINDKDLRGIINYEYQSIVKKNDFSVLEDEEDLEKRVKKFFEYLKRNFYNQTVLIVTHKGVINKIKDVYLKKTAMDEDFTTGSIEEFEII